MKSTARISAGVTSVAWVTQLVLFTTIAAAITAFTLTTTLIAWSSESMKRTS